VLHIEWMITISLKIGGWFFCFVLEFFLKVTQAERSKARDVIFFLAGTAKLSY